MRSTIANWLQSFEPDATLTDVWQLTGGISSRMTAFTVERRGATQTRVVRQPGDWTLNHVPDAVGHEYRRLGALHRAGLPVPSPVFVDPSGTRLGRPSLVIDFIEGSPELQPDDREGYLHQCARQLAQIHRVDPHTADLCLQGAAPARFGDIIDETPVDPDPVFQVDRILAALQRQAQRSIVNAPVLCHGDFWPGNMLWRNSQLVGVIDWEEPTAGDPCADLAISRLDMYWILGPEAMRTFTEHYLEANPVDTSLLPLWDLRTALRPVRNIAEWAAAYTPLGRPDITAATMCATHVAFVEQAFDALG